MADRPARDRIELSAAARAHALFPIMDFIAAKTASQSQKFNALEANQAKLEQDVTEIKRVLEELHRLVQQTVKNSFSLKESGFEAPLRSGVAAFYCNSIEREISAENLAKVVRTVLKGECQDINKYEIALKYVKKMASTFRTEERRRVLGIAPCQNMGKLTTDVLVGIIMTYLKAPDSRRTAYTRNLLVLRKYVRSTVNHQEKFWANFKEWLNATYPPRGTPSEEEIKIIEEEDRQYFTQQQPIADDTVQEIEQNDDHDNGFLQYSFDI